MKHKKGFTLVELLAVIIILIILSLITLFAANKITERSRMKSFIAEANTFAKAALNKYYADKVLDSDKRDDLYNGSVNGRVCYSITDHLFKKYVTKNKDSKYAGSVEVCYGSDCTYQTKIWFTDNDKYNLNGATNFKDSDDIEFSRSEENFYSCGYDTIGSSVGTASVAEFDYTGEEKVMTILKDGYYRLEVWGAQGGDYKKTRTGGFGGYSYAEVELKKGDKLYINVGGKGAGECISDNSICVGSYNGGSKGGKYVAAGGGATHIAFKSGELFDVPIQFVYLIAGGGGGGNANSSSADNACGYTTSEYCSDSREWCHSQVGRYGKYGGFKRNDGDSYRGHGGGYSVHTRYTVGYGDNNYPRAGTGYVFNPLTRNSAMYCYNCPGSDISFSTSRTIVNKAVSKDPIPKYSKIGNGYARITYTSNYPINYKLEGGSLASGVTNPTFYNSEDNNITLNNPTKNNYTFIGWNDGTNLFDSNSTSYKASAYINAEGAEVDHDEYSIYELSVTPNTNYAIVNSGKSTAPGYAIFDSSGNYIVGDGYRDRSVIGFTTPNNASTIRFSVVTKNNSSRYDRRTFRFEQPVQSLVIPTGSTGAKNFTARYKPTQFTISYTLDGGTATNKTTYNIEDESIAINNPVKDGYTFLGWTGSNGSTPQVSISINKGSSGDKSYTALYEKTT